MENSPPKVTHLSPQNKPKSLTKGKRRNIIFSSSPISQNTINRGDCKTPTQNQFDNQFFDEWQEDIDEISFGRRNSTDQMREDDQLSFGRKESPGPFSDDMVLHDYPTNILVRNSSHIEEAISSAEVIPSSQGLEPPIDNSWGVGKLIPDKEISLDHIPTADIDDDELMIHDKFEESIKLKSDINCNNEVAIKDLHPTIEISIASSTICEKSSEATSDKMPKFNRNAKTLTKNEAMLVEERFASAREDSKSITIEYQTPTKSQPAKMKIPYPDGPAGTPKTVRWLLNETRLRYLETHNSDPTEIIALEHDGEILCPRDALSFILDDGDVVQTVKR